MWARRLFLSLVVAAGTITCLGIVAAWCVSTVREGGVLVRDWHGARLVEIRHGVFHSRYDRTSRYFNYPDEHIWAPVEFHLAAPWGYNVGKEVKPFKSDFQGIVDFRLPLVFPFLAALAVVVLAAWRLRWITRKGHCRQCGYNLTGNRSGKCSECGTPCVAPSPTAPAEVQRSVDPAPAPPTPVAQPAEQPQRRWPLRVACTLATVAMLTWTAGLSISFIEHWREMRHRDPELEAVNPPGEVEAVRLTKWELKKTGRDAFLHDVKPYSLAGEWYIDCTSDAGDLVRFRMDTNTGRLNEVGVPKSNATSNWCVSGVPFLPPTPPTVSQGGNQVIALSDGTLLSQRVLQTSFKEYLENLKRPIPEGAGIVALALSGDYYVGYEQGGQLLEMHRLNRRELLFERLDEADPMHAVLKLLKVQSNSSAMSLSDRTGDNLVP